MGFPKVRRSPHLVCLLGVGGIALLTGVGAAIAGPDSNDLQLINLCGFNATGPQECSWVQRDGSGVITSPVTPDAAGQTRFRSLMSELGVAIAPRLMTPADTLGYAGFQFSAELGYTKINRDRLVGDPSGPRIAYWDGVAAVNPTARDARRPEQYLTTVGGYVRKGLWLPLPAFEFGAGALTILNSHLYVLQGYAKLALQEGFHGWPIPSFAVRGSASQLLGSDQVMLTVYGLDLLVSKAFSLAGTARIEPFGGWSMLFIVARSGVIDATPSCDAFAVKQAAEGDAAPSAGCAAAQNGSWNDLNANFTFPDQSVITRQRIFGGVKLKLSVLFLAMEFDAILKGTSSDDNHEGVRDQSGSQQTYSLSAGFDF